MHQLVNKQNFDNIKMHGTNVNKNHLLLLFASALESFSLELGKSRNTGKGGKGVGDPQEAQHAASPRV